MNVRCFHIFRDGSSDQNSNCVKKRDGRLLAAVLRQSERGIVRSALVYIFSSTVPALRWPFPVPTVPQTLRLRQAFSEHGLRQAMLGPNFLYFRAVWVAQKQIIFANEAANKLTF